MERSLAARFPAGNCWPAEMRADMAAAYLDYETTGKLSAAIERSEAPRCSVTRIYNGRRVPVWSRAACDAFIQRRHDLSSTTPPAANDNELVFNAAEFV
jgi:hypothetical protein